MSSFRARRSALALVGASAMLVLLSGCGGDDPEDGASTDTRETTSTAAPAETAEDRQEVLEAVALDDEDLPPGQRFELYEGGDEVIDQVTMDLCGAAFPSEALRTARLQQGSAGAADDEFVSNENVLYRDAAAAEQALTELREVVELCPADEFLPSSVEGVPDLRYDLTPLGEDQLGPLAEDHVAFGAVVAARDGESFSQTSVFLRRGRVVTVLYMADPGAARSHVATLVEHLGALSPDDAQD